MDIDLFGCPGIGVAETFGNKLYGDTFSIQSCSEVVTQGMRPESRYPGIVGKFFTETVQTVSQFIALCKVQYGRIGFPWRLVEDFLAGSIEWY